MKKRNVLIAAAVLLVSVAGYVEFLRGSPAAPPFRFDAVSAGSIKSTVITTGTVNPVTSVVVGSQVSGTIAHPYADFNSEVKKGDVIAQIDSTFLAESVKQAKDALDQARAAMTLAEETFSREKALHERGLDAQQSFDSALTVKEASEAAVKSAEASYREAETNLGYATIRAPISGVVTDREVNVGQTVAASYSAPTLFTIANDLHRMQVECTVDESDIGMVAVGEQATFTVDAYPGVDFPGTVTQVRLEPVNIQNVVTYTVVISVRNDDLKLMPGMTADVNIQVATAQDCMRVPNMALRFRPTHDLIDSSAMSSAAKATTGGNDTLQSEGHRAGGLVTQEDRPTQVPYGITARYPEIEKTGADTGPETRGRVWIVDAKGKLIPVPVVTGITDGRYTQVTSPDLKTGERIVVGVDYAVSGEQAKSPFTPTGPSRPFGRIFR